MKITLNHEEISAAIRLYVADIGIDLSGKELEIEFTAGRKDSGYTATIDIIPNKAVTQQRVYAPEDLRPVSVFTEEPESEPAVESSEIIPEENKMFEELTEGSDFIDDDDNDDMFS